MNFWSELAFILTHDHLLQVLGASWGIYIICLSIWIILKKRPPISTISWILALAFLPYFGFIIYHFLGPQKLSRQRHRRLLAKTALKQHADYLHLRDSIRADKNHSPVFMQLAKMIQTISGFPVTTANSLRLLVDGEATYNAIFNAIRAARHHVHLEYYIFEPDRIGYALRDLLIEKSREGVAVRLLVDGLGSSHLNKRFIAPLEEAGVQFAVFHRPHIRQLLRPLLNFRTHRKIVVCDGHIGFTGGINITDTEDERTTTNAYHDTHLELTGNIVHWLQLTFIEDWFYTTRQTNPDLSPYFPIQPVGKHFVQIIPSGPDNDWESIHRFYLGMINNAEKRIWLTTPYFVPSEAALLALTSAALRGVDVRLLVPHMSDSRVVTAAARSYYEELMRSGIRIWEFRDRMLHSKTMVIDDQYCIIGTANFDPRSFRLNFEVCTAAYDMHLTQALSKQFLQDLKRSQLVSRHRVISRPAQVFEAIARLLSPLL